MSAGLRGFLAGTIGLIVLYVVTERGASGRLATGGDIITTFIRRIGSPDIAGVRQVTTTVSASLQPNPDGGPVQGFIRPLPTQSGTLQPNPALSAGRAPVRFV